MNFQHGAISEQSCDACGYSLHGLPVGAKCPECGHGSGAKSTPVRDTTMSAQAPGRYIKWIRVGFLLCMLSTIGGLSGPILARLAASGNTKTYFPIAMTAFVLASVCWTIGLWMITRNRIGLGTITRDSVLDSSALRTTIRLVAFAWPCWIILVVMGARMYGTIGAGGSPLPYNILVATLGLVSWIGLVPVSIYFAGLAHWAPDERTAGQLRGVAWFLMVFGVITVISSLLASSSLSISYPAKITLAWGVVLTSLTTMFFFYAMFKVTLVLNWALSHQRISADKYTRLNARIAQEHGTGFSTPTGAAAGATAATSSARKPCMECGYDLKGLKLEGICPECGVEYGGTLLFSVRDPAKDTPRHDATPLDVAESTHADVRHSRPLGIPLEDAPDPADFNLDDELGDELGDIPLA